MKTTDAFAVLSVSVLCAVAASAEGLSAPAASALGKIREGARAFAEKPRFQPSSAGAPASSAQAGPCRDENRFLGITSFRFRFQPDPPAPNVRVAPLEMLFTPNSCTDWLDEREGTQGTLAAVRNYRGDKAYDMVLTTHAGSKKTDISLILRADGGGGMMAGYFGSTSADELARGPVEQDGYIADPRAVTSPGYTPRPGRGRATITPIPRLRHQ